MFKAGDKVIFIKEINGYKVGETAILYIKHNHIDYYNGILVPSKSKEEIGFYANHPLVIDNIKLYKGNNMLKEVLSDGREFVKQHRSVIYTLVLLVLADHFFFKGKLRERLQAMAEKLLSKAEEKVQLVK